MIRVLVMGSVGVAVVAGLKTWLVASFLLTDALGNLGLVSGLFAVFFGLTAAVAYLSFTQICALLERQRKEKLAPGASEPVAKETIILRHAPDWGLSQAEADVAIFVAKGFSNAEIAEMRGCAVATVKTQLGRIYQKSGLASRYQLIAFVTDEVCSMANEAEEDSPQIVTRNVLPLAGRKKPTPENTQIKLAGA